MDHEEAEQEELLGEGGGGGAEAALRAGIYGSGEADPQIRRYYRKSYRVGPAGEAGPPGKAEPEECGLCLLLFHGKKAKNPLHFLEKYAMLLRL